MLNLDDTLQTQLAALESGVPLETVLANLPDEARELVPLIKLAAESRSLPSPQMRSDAVRAQRVRVTGAAQARAARPFFPAWLTHPKALLAVGSTLAIFTIVAVFTLGTALYMAGPASAHSARLANVSGWVEVAPSADSSDWRFVSGGEQVRQGQRIRTYAESSATLIFFDGTRSVVGADADLTLTKLDGSWGDVLQVQIDQKDGVTSHDVIPLRGSSSMFQVNTPSGRANVHGTSFMVAVSPKGESLFSVVHGNVGVLGAGSEVFLDSGQATAVLDGQNPEQPAYQFTLEGSVTAQDAASWTVAGVQVIITQETEILGTIGVDDHVVVQGRIPTPGQLVADRIEPTEKQREKAKFTGVIESMPGVPGIWQISGHNLQVDAETELSAGLAMGSAVEVTFTVLPGSGGWLAKEIQLLNEVDENKQPTATPTTTSTATVAPNPDLPVSTATLTPTPTMTGTPGTATPTPTVTTTPTVVPKNDTNRCDNRTQAHPEGLRLAQRFGVTYEEIMDWFCKGFGFGEIDLAYSLSLETGKPVSEIFTMRVSGLGWGQVKKQVVAQMTAENPASNATGTPVPAKPGKGNGGHKK